MLAPRTIVDVLALKLHVGHQRADSKVAKMIQMNEENTRISYGHSASVIETERKYKPNNVTWSDETQEKLQRRQLEMINKTNESRWFTKNDAIMDYVVKRIKIKKK